MKNRLKSVERCGAATLVVAVTLAFALSASAQTLRFTTGHREIDPPDYATFKIGPLYSTVRFEQTVGLRYSESMVNVVDERHGAWRGIIKSDGLEIPLVSRLLFRNYAVLTKQADLDVSVWLGYAHFPLDTQEDEFVINVADENVRLDISVEMRPTEYIRLFGYLHPIYVTDYVDLRGLKDQYGGERYERFENTIGGNADWLLDKDSNLGLSASRHDVRPKSSIFETQDRTAYEVQLVYQRMLDPLLMIGAMAAYNTAQYPKSQQPEYDAQHYSLFANAELTKFCRGSASVGYSLSSISPWTEGAEDIESDSVFGGASLAMELGPRLSHSLSYARNQIRGFESGIDRVDSFSYVIQRSGEFLPVSLRTTFNSVATEGGAVTAYSDWVTSLSLSCPVTPGITLRFQSTYSERNNGEAAEGFPEEIEEWVLADYSTWSSKLETGFALSAKMSLSAYGEYVVRHADIKSQAYERFVTGVDISYSHEF